MYPENWRVTDEQATPSEYEVSVQAPGGGFWSLHVFAHPTNPAGLADQVVQSMRQEYDSLESQDVTEVIGDAEAVGSDMDFFCLDFVVTARARAFRKGPRTYLVLYQAESREFEQIEPVFRAMTISLLRDGSLGN